LFVPMDASLAFPCFDQPDLKARFNLEITAPDNWAVVSNSRGSDERFRVRSGFLRRYFTETPPISTYLFAFAAGPFKQVRKNDLEPLRLLVRQSKWERAKEEWPEIERLTREGIKHMEEFFGRSFPFGKYDQVLIPGFAYGGEGDAGGTFLPGRIMPFRHVPTQHHHPVRPPPLRHQLAQP